MKISRYGQERTGQVGTNTHRKQKNVNYNVQYAFINIHFKTVHLTGY